MPVSERFIELFFGFSAGDLDAINILSALGSVVYRIVLYACAWLFLRHCARWRLGGRQAGHLISGEDAAGDGYDATKSAGSKKKKNALVPPLLLYKRTDRNRRLVEQTTLLRQPYVPTPWLNHNLGGHMQSFMFATWCPPSERGAVSRLVSREELVVSSFDGGAFRLDWFDLSGTSLPAEAPVVFVLPGVVGQGTNVYVRHLAAHFTGKYGWRVVAKSWRGIGSRLTTRRPETWDHTALSDARDSIRHIRTVVGHDVPLMGVGFSFGGCLLTALAGSVPQEEHGLCGMVSISGLFDMVSMMKHIAEQYSYPYGCANTRVTVMNYRKFKVLETLTAAEVAAAVIKCNCMQECPGDCNTAGSDEAPASADGLESDCSAQSAAANIGGGGSGSRAAWSSDDNFHRSLPDPATAVSAMAASSASRSTSSSAVIISKRMDRKMLETDPTKDCAANGSQSAGEQETGRAGTSQEVSSMSKLLSFDSITSSSSSSSSDSVDNVSEGSNTGLGLAGASSPRLGGGSRIVGVKAKDLVKMTDPIEFHEALTLPFTGDASVDAYYSRIEEVMSRDLSSVKVPTLALLARDDPLCPPPVWEGALARAAESEGTIVAITDQGGHCGWFDGLGAGSWLDKAAGDFLACALEMKREDEVLNARSGDNAATVSAS